MLSLTSHELIAMKRSLPTNSDPSDSTRKYGGHKVNRSGESMDIGPHRDANQAPHMPGPGGLNAIVRLASSRQQICSACETGGAPCPACSLSMSPTAGFLQRRQLQRKPADEEGQRVRTKRRPDAAAEDGAGKPLDAVEKIRSGGEPLPESVRRYFEPRFSTDLSGVRIHTGQAAAEATHAVNARAFTLGDSIAFAPGQFMPSQADGRRLLAHELAHVVQHDNTVHGKKILARTPAPEPAAQEGPVLPGYSQVGDTCGAASLVTALMVYDRQKGNHDASIAAIENILTWLIQHRSATIEGWDIKGIDGEEKYSVIKSYLEIVRDSLLDGSDISEVEYQSIAVALYFLYIDKTKGLSSLEIEKLQKKLGLYSGESDLINSGADLFSNSIVTGLKAGEIAQLGWYVKTSGPDSKGKYELGHHAFLVGRLETGEWYLHDQGIRPATRYVNNTLPGLEQHVRAESAADRYWLFFGTFTMRVAGGWTGAEMLAGGEGPENKQADLVPSGTYLAEIDYSSIRFGDELTSGNFLGVAHSRENDYFVCDSSGGASKGRLMVEMPEGAFLVYETNAISSHNLAATSIDASEGGLLTKKTFYSAALTITDGIGCKTIKVY
ncbi:MAG: DUF4157 domain-containing protein [Candidatus Thiodiazotropha sp. (ex Lucina pensylvanica)]|nr:DUF4157 domain-containing protein [Candidatus Thiodiazotropha sp. (ex Lucina pensylvanica)]